MKREKPFELSMLDLIEEELVSLSDKEILESCSSNNFEEISDFKNTQSLIDKATQRNKKIKLIKARKELDESKSKSSSSSINLANAKDILIRLMSQGRLPGDLTLAFREGKDIPDEELISILEDLKDLGVDINDE